MPKPLSELNQKPKDKGPKVDYVRDDVRDMLPKWQQIRDCLDPFKIKAGRDTYLVKQNASDTSAANKDRFEARLKRAVFYGVTARTLAGLVGQVFAKEPSTELPLTLEPFIQDADGSGIALDQQAKLTFGLVLAYGRAGLLVDYPTQETPEGETAVTTRQDLIDGNVRPTVVVYEPWNIINWRIRKVGAKSLASLVVLVESYLKSDDGFEPVYDVQYRVLRLNDADEYTVEIFRKLEGEWVSDGPQTPLDHSGQPLREIPFRILGAESNSWDIGPAPLLDMSTLNIAHYNNSADNEDSIHYVGSPMFWFGGLTEQWVKNTLKGSVRIGSSEAILLPANGSAGIVQADPNTLAKEGMEHKERQMVALGAKLVEQKTVQRTATESSAEEASETSVLTSCADNVSTGYTQALGDAALFIGETNVSDNALAYELNTDLAVFRMTAQDRAQLVAEWQAGAMDWEEFRWNMRRAGLVYKDDNAVKAAVEADTGIGGEPDADPELTKKPEEQ